MKITKIALSAALRELARVAPAKPAVPILSHVLVEATNGILTLRATDMDRDLSTTLSVEGDLAPTCLPLKALLALAKPESRKDTGLVDIDAADATATIIVDDTTSKLSTLPAGDFPEAMSTDDLSLVALWPATELHDALAYVLPAANDDVTRPHLCGVNLSDNRAKATDGHRLHIAALPTAIPEGMGPEQLLGC
jgi:DNA polymerase III subunit beta